MNNSEKLFADEFAYILIKASGLKIYQCQMSIYYKYALYGKDIVVLYYIYDCVYWYISEALGKLFVETIGKRFHVNFLGYAHRFM